MLYRLATDGLYTRSESDSEWTTPVRPMRPRGFGSFDPIGGRPLWLRVDETREGRLFRAVGIRFRGGERPILSVSDDSGKTWSPIVRALDPLAEWIAGTAEVADLTGDEIKALVALSEQFPITDIRVDASDSDRWYGLMASGVAITEDAGKTWRVSKEGLDIPVVESLSTPRASNDLYVGTPAGLYISRDKGQTWEDTSLILQYEGTQREEISGAAYLTAYWMGRYHNFITDETATAEWWK